MSGLGTALAVVIGINIMLWLGQVAVLQLNPAAPVFYSCTDSIIGAVEANNCQGTTYVLNDGNILNNLPSGTSTINIGNGNTFTDTFAVGLGWISNSLGLKYLYNIVAAPTNFFKAIGTPPEMSYVIGAAWYLITFIIIVAFLLGRDT